MNRFAPAALWLVAAGLGACTEAQSQTGLESDYVLSSTDPQCANVTDILMRYEDDWLPGTCVGYTHKYDATRVLLQWSCRYDTNAGPTAGAPIEGTLSDPEGDGTFEGYLYVRTLPDVNSTLLDPVAAHYYTMTPLP